ncbi:MAG: hypothetical protein WC473_00680 [Patescibacteria group bacterium]|jgi:hypothetical protein
MPKKRVIPKQTILDLTDLQDLSGWRLARCYEVLSSKREHSVCLACDFDSRGFYDDSILASIASYGIGWWGGDGVVREVLVLTQDGRNGFIPNTADFVWPSGKKSVSGSCPSLIEILSEKEIPRLRGHIKRNSHLKHRLTSLERELLGL